MSDESIRSPHQVFPTERAGRWTDEERYGLTYLRNLNSHLSWTELHKLNFFPNRSQIALYNEHHRMEKLNTKRRVELPKDRSNASPLLKPKRPRVHDPRTSQARPDKQARITIDDDESNDDDGDIQGDGETKKLQFYSCQPQEQSRPPDCPRKSSSGSSGQAPPGPARQKMSYSPPSGPAAKPSESPSKKPFGSPPAASKPQPTKAPSPIRQPATVPPVMQSQPQNLGMPVTSYQPDSTAVPRTPSHGNSSGTTAAETSNVMNLSLPHRPPIQSGTTESGAITSTDGTTPKIPANPSTTTTTTTQQNKPPQADQANVAIPATEPKPNSIPYKGSPIFQCMIGQSQLLMQEAQFWEQEVRTRAEIDRRLAFQAAVNTKGVETKLDQLREKFDEQSKVIDSQAKEIQLLKAEREDTALRKEIDELKNSGSEQFAAFATRIEGLREDIQKVMKFEGKLRGALNECPELLS